jgi:hypothetical protein
MVEKFLEWFDGTGESPCGAPKGGPQEGRPAVDGCWRGKAQRQEGAQAKEAKAQEGPQEIPGKVKPEQTSTPVTNPFDPFCLPLFFSCFSLK